MRSGRSRRRLPSSSSRSRSGRPLVSHSSGPDRSNPPFVAITRSFGYGCNASAISCSLTCGAYDSAVSISVTPSSMARRSTTFASLRSFGGPQTPRPVIRIAPKPRRWTGRSLPKRKVSRNAEPRLGNRLAASIEPRHAPVVGVARDLDVNRQPALRDAAPRGARPFPLLGRNAALAQRPLGELDDVSGADVIAGHGARIHSPHDGQRRVLRCGNKTARRSAFLL